MKSLILGAAFFLISFGLALAVTGIDNFKAYISVADAAQTDQPAVDQPTDEPPQTDKPEMGKSASEAPTEEHPPVTPPAAEQPESEQPGLEQAPAEQPQPGT